MIKGDRRRYESFKNITDEKARNYVNFAKNLQNKYGTQFINVCYQPRARGNIKINNLDVCHGIVQYQYIRYTFIFKKTFLTRFRLQLLHRNWYQYSLRKRSKTSEMKSFSSQLLMVNV